MSGHNYIDLFAGAGGLSEGFIRQGFLPVAHVESDAAACFTLKTRLAFHYLMSSEREALYNSYLRGEISREKLYSSIPNSLLDSVINAEIGKENKRIFNVIDSILNGQPVDLIIGGPPCQAYSKVGRGALKNRDKDERTTLYIHYGRFLKKYSPRVFVFENVPGILSTGNGRYFRNLETYYKRLGYKVEAKLLNAYDYGVVQNRERVIIVGWRKEMGLTYPEIKQSEKKYHREDIFSDLPPIQPGDTQRIHHYTNITTEYLTQTAMRNGIDFVSQHIARPHNNRDLDIYRLAIKTLETGERLKNNQIPDEMRTQKNVTDFLDRFKVVGKIPHTMIAHIAKDGHHFIHPDIEQLRSISVREAARIQSFPDDYYFEGIKADQPRTAAFRQIGNAVPPLLSAALAKTIKDALHEQ
ncbi:MAG: DNA (cytosine-5-)-methyltransferase [Syntrophus sp. (in: bacteria)]|nr:DNA (cytosine-5-)-methyltransferase [Syntrophus sp. (in: bacteria)]